MSGVPQYVRAPFDGESLGQGFRNVATAGTQVPLVASSTAASRVLIQAKSTNAGLIFIGNSSVPNTHNGGISLSAGSFIQLDLLNLNVVYVNAATNGDGVTYIYWN